MSIAPFVDDQSSLLRLENVYPTNYVNNSLDDLISEKIISIINNSEIINILEDFAYFLDLFNMLDFVIKI